jgi:hypothetical protein
MTKDEALKLALSALNEVRQETFRLLKDSQTLYSEKKVWEAIYTIKKVLAQEQEPTAPPQRKPLTDEQINAFFQGIEPNNGFWLSFAKAIEAAHGINE